MKKTGMQVFLLVIANTLYHLIIFVKKFHASIQQSAAGNRKISLKFVFSHRFVDHKFLKDKLYAQIASVL